MFNRYEISDPTKPATRVHYPWHELEEYLPDGGMWKIPASQDRSRLAQDAQDLMAVPDEFADAMRRVLVEWCRSVAVALTTPNLNRRAWIGHAGCYLATGSPEETTRLGWHALDDAEQYGANAAADMVISEWKQSHRPLDSTTVINLSCFYFNENEW